MEYLINVEKVREHMSQGGGTPSVNLNTNQPLPSLNILSPSCAGVCIIKHKKKQKNYMTAKLNFFQFIFAFATLLSCKPVYPQLSPAPGMFKVAILYPDGEGKTFDMDYYQKKHMPMLAGILGKNLKFYEIDKGISGRVADGKAPFVAIGYFYVSDVAEYNKAIAQNRDAVIRDIKNYTNIQPVVQISEIKQVTGPGAN